MWLLIASLITLVLVISISWTNLKGAPWVPTPMGTIHKMLKLAEVELMRAETGEHPVLLLDDVLSELDAQRRKFLVGRLNNGPQQAVVTTTDLQMLPPAFLHSCRLWRVEMGSLSAVPPPRERAGPEEEAAADAGSGCASAAHRRDRSGGRPGGQVEAG